MELNELKGAWQTMEIPEKDIPGIRSMLKENRHPVLRKIRTQLTLEITGWCVFLLLYYTALDGETKPAAVNIAFVSAVSLIILFHFRGYFLSKHLIHGVNISDSLNNYFQKLRQYAAWSIGFRALFLVSLLFYFTYGVTMDGNRYLLLSVIVTVFLGQMYLLLILWRKRLKKLAGAIVSFQP